MAREFVSFHRELTKGTKRGLSRATRFVYLELSLEARALEGDIPLPAYGDLADAVHDLLGGSKKEIKEALSALLSAEKEGDEPMISVRTEAGQRVLTVVAWGHWNTRPKSNSRVQRYRLKQKRDCTVVGNALHGVTEGVTSTVTGALRNALKEKRGEEKRGEEISEAPPIENSEERELSKAEKIQRAWDSRWRAISQGVQKATGAPCYLGDGSGPRAAIEGLLKAHTRRNDGSRLSALDECAWLEDQAERWARDCPRQLTIFTFQDHVNNHRRTPPVAPRTRQDEPQAAPYHSAAVSPLDAPLDGPAVSPDQVAELAATLFGGKGAA